MVTGQPRPTLRRYDPISLLDMGLRSSSHVLKKFGVALFLFPLSVFLTLLFSLCVCSRRVVCEHNSIRKGCLSSSLYTARPLSRTRPSKLAFATNSIRFGKFVVFHYCFAVLAAARFDQASGGDASISSSATTMKYASHVTTNIFNDNEATYQ